MNIARFYQLHLRDLSIELILFQLVIEACDSADVLLPATYVLFHTTAAFQPFNEIVVVVVFPPSLPLCRTTNTFPRSGSTCAQGICLRVSQQISLGQGAKIGLQ